MKKGRDKGGGVGRKKKRVGTKEKGREEESGLPSLFLLSFAKNSTPRSVSTFWIFEKYSNFFEISSH